MQRISIRHSSDQQQQYVALLALHTLRLTARLLPSAPTSTAVPTEITSTHSIVSHIEMTINGGQMRVEAVYLVLGLF